MTANNSESLSVGSHQMDERICAGDAALVVNLAQASKQRLCSAWVASTGVLAALTGNEDVARTRVGR